MVVSTPTIINENADYSGIETDGDGGAFHNIGDVTVSGDRSSEVLWDNDMKIASGATLNIGKSVLNLSDKTLESEGTLKLTVSGLTDGSDSFTGGVFKTSGTLTVGGLLFVTVDPSVSLADATGELQLIEASDYTGVSFTDVGVSGGYTIEDMGDGKFIIRRAPDPTPSSSSDAAASVYGVRATAKAVRNAVLTRADGGFVSGGYKGTSGGDEPAQYGLWAQGVAGDFHRKGASDGDVYGFVAGFDGKVSDTLTAGFGYGYTYVSEKSPDARAKTRMHNGFVYARYQPSEWFLNAVAGGGFGESEIKEGASYDTWYADANATLGKDYATQIGVITPLATLRYTFVKADDVSVTADWRGAFTTHYRDNTASLSLRFDF